MMNLAKSLQSEMMKFIEAQELAKDRARNRKHSEKARSCHDILAKIPRELFPDMPNIADEVTSAAPHPFNITHIDNIPRASSV